MGRTGFECTLRFAGGAETLKAVLDKRPRTRATARITGSLAGIFSGNVQIRSSVQQSQYETQRLLKEGGALLSLVIVVIGCLGGCQSALNCRGEAVELCLESGEDRLGERRGMAQIHVRGGLKSAVRYGSGRSIKLRR